MSCDRHAVLGTSPHPTPRCGLRRRRAIGHISQYHHLRPRLLLRFFSHFPSFVSMFFIHFFTPCVQFVWYFIHFFLFAMRNLGQQFNFTLRHTYLATRERAGTDNSETCPRLPSPFDLLVFLSFLFLSPSSLRLRHPGLCVRAYTEK